MIKLVDVNEDNFSKVIRLKIKDEQKGFVSDNTYSLAQCYIYRNNGDVFPYAVLNEEDEVVGFLLAEIDREENYYMIWRMMIGSQFQGHGYGKAVINEVIKIAKEDPKISVLKVDYVRENEAMKHILEDLKFTNVGYEKEINEEINELNVD